MLCFAAFGVDADDDQGLFDVSKGLINDEYPVVYFHQFQSAERSCPGRGTSREFLEEFYPRFTADEDDWGEDDDE